jgi:glycosyltransferase involved in cell wall biosynthesis
MSVFSIIVPTIHRTDELSRLLDSVAAQKSCFFSLGQLHIIIVDQNEDDRLAAIVRPYEGLFQVERLKAPPLGQSHAKNMGMERIRGKYVGFPDDDCFYNDDTLDKVYRAFQETKDSVALFGRCWDKETGQYLLRYPAKNLFIRSPKSPLVFLGLQIAQFYTADMAKSVGHFDVDLCSGGKWGSGEETDFAIRFLKGGGNIQYRPEILVNHPLVVPQTMPLEKVRRYALGFGALCRKQGLGALLVAKAAKQAAGFLFFILQGDRKRAMVFGATAISRLKGYWSYRP